MAFELLSGRPASGKKAYIKDKIRGYIRKTGGPASMLVLANSSDSAEDIRRYTAASTAPLMIYVH